MLENYTNQSIADWDANVAVCLTPESQAELDRIVEDKKHSDGTGFVYTVFLVSYQPNGYCSCELVTIHSAWEKAVKFCFRSENDYLERMRVDPKLFWYWTIVRKRVDSYRPEHIPQICIRYQREIQPNPHDIGYVEFATLLLKEPYQFQQWCHEVDIAEITTNGNPELSDLLNLFYQFCLDYGITEKGGYLEVETAQYVLDELLQNIEWLNTLSF